MAVPRRRRVLRVALMALSTVIAIPASVAIRRAFFPSQLGVRSIQQETSYQDPALLERAWHLPVAATYQRRLFFEPNGTVGGPASVANVQRSFGRAAASVDSVLSGSGKCWTGLCWMELSLDDVAELARHATGRNVTVLDDLTPAQWRAELPHLNDLTRRYIVGFRRSQLFGAGGAQHSPVGAYLAADDLVLVLDMDEHFKPWLVSSERLFEAIAEGDGGNEGGLLRIE